MFKQILLALTLAQCLLANNLTCQPNKYLDQKKKCQYCPQHCSKCLNETTCISCNDGFFLIKLKNQSQSCQSEAFNSISNCISIEEQELDQICSECREGYWLKSGKECAAVTFGESCKLWEKNVETEQCNEAKEGYFVANKIPEQCLGNCQICQNNSECEQCKADYFLGTNKTQCIKKTGNCKEWMQQNEEQCKYCEKGYSIVMSKYCFVEECTSKNEQNVCAPKKARNSLPLCEIDCNENCLVCETTEKCSKCEEGFILVHEKCEVSSVDNCISGKDKSTCEECKDGFFVEEGKCNKCSLDNCGVCNKTDCEKCEKGYTLINNECQKNPENCEKMESEKCVKCVYGFRTDNGTCIKCDQNCAQCSQSECIQCQSGYFLYKPTGICISCAIEYSKYVELNCSNKQRREFAWKCTDLIDNCIENKETNLIGEKDQQCKVCDDNYALKGSSCVKCADQNCQDCQSDENKCNECAIGYYLDDNNKCKPCDKTCIQCTKDECIECNQSLVFSEGEKTKCNKCEDNNCFKCNQKDICIECSLGYYLNELKCMECDEKCANCYNNTFCIDCKEEYLLTSENECKPEKQFLCNDGFYGPKCNYTCQSSIQFLQIFIRNMLNMQRKRQMQIL